MNVSQAARYHMIDGQLEPNQVLEEHIVAAMSVTPREAFVPEAYQANAYVDDNIPLGQGRYLMAPVVFGRLLQAAAVDPGDKVLVVGGATGYSATVIAQLGAKVVVVEEQRELADKARQVLAEKGQGGVEIKTSALYLGCESGGPYDVIFVDGAVSEVPEGLFKQLAEGGCLVTVRNVTRRPGEDVGLGRAVRFTQTSDGLVEDALFDANVPVISVFKQKENFTF